MPKTVYPDAIPYIRQAGKNLRSWEIAYHGNPLSIPTHMVGQPPEEIVGAVAYVESGDDPFGVPDSPDGAVGPMQLTINGREVGAWNNYDWLNATRQPKMTIDRLRDVQTNFDVGTFGLEFDREELQNKSDVAESAKQDWFASALYYFGCTPLPDGSPDPNCGDIYNNAVRYQHKMEQYVTDHYGVSGVANVKAGGGTGTATGTDSCSLTDVGCWAIKIADATIGTILGPVEKALPRIGLAVLGLGITVIGFKGLAS